VHFLAGASDPEWLPLRVNDLIHWHTIKRANADGFEVYRLGPIFRTVPQDWPIARVSRFKAKWGAESVPVIQGSYFRRPERYAA
jgi:lipid II:glycine glycyltransferase (peptidoglycan interpeptide bridge formation enzyme)